MSSRLELVGTEDEETDGGPHRPVPPPKTASRLDVGLLTLALQTLSKRALIAVESCFTLLTVGSAFWLWSTIPDPNTNQIVSLTLYAGFVLAANVIVRRGR